MHVERERCNVHRFNNRREIERKAHVRQASDRLKMIVAESIECIEYSIRVRK